MAERYLFRFGYSWPAAIEHVERHPDDDLDEDSAMVFVVALSVEDAIELGSAFAEELVRKLFGPDAYSWRQLAFAHWIESDPEIIRQAEADTPVVCSPESLVAVAESMSRRWRAT